MNIGPSNNVVWSIDVPWSPSSPIIWGERIFLTSYDDQQLQTRCYDARNGTLLWVQGIKPEQLESFHKTESSPAASTPASDGRHVVSYFGSFGLVCYDLNGKESWRHPLPVAISGGSYGSGTSPVIAGGLVILNRDQDRNSSLLAVDVATGRTAWETSRPDATGSFGTPVVWKNEKIEEVIAAGSLRLKGYDLRTGKERWVAEGMPAFACTTPVVGDDLLFFAGWSPGKTDAPWPAWEIFAAQFDKDKDGAVTFDELPEGERDYMTGADVNHDGKLTKEDWDQLMARNAKSRNVLLAIKPGGQGDISQTHVAWSFTRGLPYVSSPLYYQDRIYLIKDGGMLSCFDAKTGNPYYLQERLEAIGHYYSSPVAADGRIYVASQNGKITVVKAGGDKPEVLHQADLGDRIFATPALAGDRMYVRTQKRLYAFGGETVAAK